MRYQRVGYQVDSWLWGGLPACMLLWLVLAAGAVSEANRTYQAVPPIVDARAVGYQPVAVAAQGPEQMALTAPDDEDAPVALTGPAFAQPGESITYTLTLQNAERLTRTYQLSVTLPAGLAYIPGSAADLVYDAARQTLSWQGDLAPGHLTYLLETQGAHLPYLDLADLGVPNLCDDFIAATGGCIAASVTFNLGSSGYAARLFGQPLRQLTVSTDGIISGELDAAAEEMASPRWLPDADVSGPLLAGLWRPTDMTSSGRWHAAIVGGLVVGYDVFYAQWQDAPAAANPDLTARFAVAIVLERDGETPGPLSGHIFFLYDNISDAAGFAAAGYTIGAADRIGERGLTYAFAPSHGDEHPPQGFPPDAGTTLHLRPIWAGTDQPYQRTFYYQTVVQAAVPATLAQTAAVHSSSPDPMLAFTWDTHYLAVRWQTYLPVVSVRAASGE